MSLPGSPASIGSRSPGSPQSNRSNSPAGGSLNGSPSRASDHGSHGRRSQSRSRSGSPEIMGSDRSRSPRSHSGSPRSQGSRTASSHSSDGGREEPQVRKDIEDSGSEDEQNHALQPDKKMTPQEEDEPMESPCVSPRGKASPARKMSVGSDNGEDSNLSPQKTEKGTSSIQCEADKVGDNEEQPKKDTSETKEAVVAEDIFGDDLSISSEDEADKSEKEATINSDQALDEEGEHRVQRYGDDHPDVITGESGSASASASPKGTGRGSRSRSRTRSKSPARYDDERGDEDGDKEGKEPEKPPETVSIHVEVPKITTNLGKELYFVKLPNFLSVDCKPFDPETYEDEIEDEDSLDEEGRARLKLKVENTVRWRQSFTAEGKAYKESNSRVVRWSDGSMTLHLGNEIFDVHKQPLQGDFNHMFIRQGTGLQGQAIFRNKLAFRPHSTESFTHQKMTRQMADRSNKATGIKVISQVGKDPEMGRCERVKEEEGRLRADLRRDSMINRKKERVTGRGLSKGYLEGGDSDEDGVSLSAIKNKFKKGKKGPDYKPAYSSEEEDSDIETKKARRLEKAKAAIRDSDEESIHSDAGSTESNKKARSRSPGKSPKSNASGGSRESSRSPGGSGRSRSRSHSGSKSRSRSQSEVGSRSRSRSRSGSPAVRSGTESQKSSGSPNKRSGSESD